MSDRSPSVAPLRPSKAKTKRPPPPSNDEPGSPSLRPSLFYSSPSALASTFERSPVDAAVNPPELPPEMELPPPVVQAHASVPDAPSARSSNEEHELLSSSAGVNADEEYSNDERLLNEFTKFHPMLR